MICEATVSSMGHTSGERPASNFTGPPIHGISCGMVIDFLLDLLGSDTCYTCWPSLIGMSRSVLGANSSSSLTRRCGQPVLVGILEQGFDRRPVRLDAVGIPIRPEDLL